MNLAERQAEMRARSNASRVVEPVQKFKKERDHSLRPVLLRPVVFVPPGGRPQFKQNGAGEYFSDRIPVAVIYSIPLPSGACFTLCGPGNAGECAPGKTAWA